MSVDILRWAMDHSKSGDVGQRARWDKYRKYMARQEQLVIAVAPEDDHDAVELVVWALAPRNCARPIVLYEDDEEEIVDDAVEAAAEDNKKATPPCAAQSASKVA